jgi:type I restriction-modification system DNA methylase subunit
LRTLLKGTNVYSRLCNLFLQADERYNSGLFHFQKEKDVPEPPDTLTPNLVLDDKPLKEIITRLYYPESPYEFSALPADVLGQVYEQFLGKVIRLTSTHHVMVEEKPEVRKAGGVYYTPTFVVDYIVKHTIGKLLEGKKPGPRGGASKIKIVDPACGSGSFLIGAYQYLLDWHRDRYVEDGPEKHRRELYQGPGGLWFLTTQEKRRILLNSIYGVDIDSQAVEVTKLSLLLKVLEGESNQSLTSQLRLFHERALPDLDRNIKCGNSLIDSSFYDVYQPSLFDEEERYRINAFDWKDEFPEIMKLGGFDAVLGNPPWGASFTEPELAYLRENYRRVINRMIDSYIYFIDRALQMVDTNGMIGFIIPSTLLNQVDAMAVRRLLMEHGLYALINLGKDIFTTKVLNTSTILITAPHGAGDDITLDNFSAMPLHERKIALETARVTAWDDWKDLVQNDPHLTFFSGNEKSNALLNRLRQEHILLGQIIQGDIQRGVSPDVVAAHVISPSEARAAKLEEELLRPSVSGGQIKRYEQWTIDQYIIYTTRATPLEKFPNTAHYLNRFKHLNTCKEVVQGKHPWWALHRPRNPQIFASPKFIGLTTSRSIQLIYDVDASIYVTDAMYVFSILPEHDPWAFMAILQSRLFLFLYHIANQGESRVIPQVKASKLISLPYPAHKGSQPIKAKLSQLSQDMFMLHKQLAATKLAYEKSAHQRQIARKDQQIDMLVYELYGLTEEEIKMVEGNQN